MRRILIVLGGLVLASFLVAGFFFIITVVYLDEAAIDLTPPPPMLGECQNSVLVEVDENDTIRIKEKIISSENIRAVIFGFAETDTKTCLTYHISELSSYGVLAKLKQHAGEAGLNSTVVIVPE